MPAKKATTKNAKRNLSSDSDSESFTTRYTVTDAAARPSSQGSLPPLIGDPSSGDAYAVPSSGENNPSSGGEVTMKVTKEQFEALNCFLQSQRRQKPAIVPHRVSTWSGYLYPGPDHEALLASLRAAYPARCTNPRQEANNSDHERRVLIAVTEKLVRSLAEGGQAADPTLVQESIQLLIDRMHAQSVREQYSSSKPGIEFEAYWWGKERALERGVDEYLALEDKISRRFTKEKEGRSRDSRPPAGNQRIKRRR